MKLTLLSSLVFACLITGCSGRKLAEKQTTPKPLIVKTASSSGMDAALELFLTGTFIAESSAALSTEVEGLVASTPVSIGQFVQRGAPVLFLDKQNAQLRVNEAEAREREALAQLEQAEARLGAGASGRLELVPEVLAAKAALEAAEAEQNLLEIEERRAAKLLGTGDVSRGSWERSRANLAMAAARTSSARKHVESTLNQARQSNGSIAGARALVESARAQLAIARKALADTVIRAPFSGYVSARQTASGEYVNNQSKFLVLDRITPLKLSVATPESEAGRLRVGMPLKASVQAYPGEDFTGRVSAISKAVNPASRTFVIEGEFDNNDARLRPGMFASVRIDLGSTERRTVIPAAALDLDPRTDTNRVWMYDGDHARLKVVEVVAKKEGQVHLRRGVTAGALVIISDHSKLYDGMPVERN